MIYMIGRRLHDVCARLKVFKMPWRLPVIGNDRL